MGFGQNVKDMLERKNIKQNELARKIGMSSSGISTALAPNANPRESTIRAIAEALGCTAGELMDGPTLIANDSDANEKKLLSIYHQLNDSGKTTALGMLVALLENPVLRQEGAISSMG